VQAPRHRTTIRRLAAMRFKLGRPDLSRYADRFDVPGSSGGLAVTFLGGREDPWSGPAG